MNYSEQVLSIDCAGETLVGVLSLPQAQAPHGTAVLVVVGGPQYRVGSHRQFVLLARALAQAGHAVLRFDYRGMGDSGGETHNFESVSDDIGCALTAFEQAVPQAERFVLWGLCDGASAALMYMESRRDPRVAGLCLANPWVRSEASLARTHVKHYYRQRLLQREFWTKLASGRIGVGALQGLARSVARAVVREPDKASAVADERPYQRIMAAGWQGFDRPLLLVLSGNDYTAKEFLDHVAADGFWRDALRRPNVRRHDLAEADHTFSDAAARRQVEAATLGWLRECWREAESPGSGRHA